MWTLVCKGLYTLEGGAWAWIIVLIKFLNMYQEDVGAEFEDAVDTGQLLEHDGVTDPTEELSDKLPNHQHHRGVQSHDAAGPDTSRRTGSRRRRRGGEDEEERKKKDEKRMVSG